MGHAGRAFDVAVEPQVATNDLTPMLRCALAGGGITAMEDTFRPHLDRGEFVSPLDDVLPPFPGFFLFFPDRRHPAPKLRALLEHVWRFRRAG